MKEDYLKECMNDVSQMSINDFNKFYCMRCGNDKCNRSRTNNSLFVERVKNWEERLFLNVPRIEGENARNLASSKFLPINPSIEIRSPGMVNTGFTQSESLNTFEINSKKDHIPDTDPYNQIPQEENEEEIPDTDPQTQQIPKPEIPSEPEDTIPTQEPPETVDPIAPTEPPEPPSTKMPGFGQGVYVGGKVQPKPETVHENNTTFTFDDD